MNSSLLLVAVHFLPEISRAVAHAQGSETARQVTRVVCAVAGTRNPFLALRRIEADMGRAAALRIRLASIACDREIALAESRHRARKGQADTRRSFPGRAHAVGLALTLGAGFLSIFALGLGRSQAALAAPRLAGPVASSLLLAAMLIAALGITTHPDGSEEMAVLAPASQPADALILQSEPAPKAEIMRPA
ncbi:Hypothetical protein HVIM_03624 [Roseomonas mucosa]|uniref:Uncharacterized protein n=1 Tax=Roseomonas mucosa TaxID=207340 RepID=A0A379MWU7_9PROT|nr:MULTISPECIES: hypothetical protein [Roseomonas]MBS5902428.1 hypothetical protein [Acetobacteraceae bacterium]MCG7354200.1 hypothetical protein [Roseomonas mucosa]MCG7357293.1 hypothetical protein [Roseomonas mucosa]MDT8289219.1 hypothetical protein [Roseomonas mucosa]MDT8293208.1 hypothetical protein [Roseomonas mucosa]